MGPKNQSEDDEQESQELSRLGNPIPFSTRTVVRSQCRTLEVEPGKFLRKCDRTQEILRDSLGRPTEVVQSNREYTEEDVTDQMLKGSFPSTGSPERGPFEFPGLRSDVEAIEKSFKGFDFPGLRDDIDVIERGFIDGLGHFFEAAEELRNGFFGVFGDPDVFESKSLSSKESTSRGIPVESNPLEEEIRKPNKPNSGSVDLSGLAREV